MNRAITLFSLAILGFVVVAEAQVRVRRSPPAGGGRPGGDRPGVVRPGVPFYGGYWGYGYGYPYYGYGYGGGGTVAESQARGMAELIRAQGEYEQQHAEAQAERERARELELQNRMQAVNDYYEMRRMREVRRAEERAQHLKEREAYKSRQAGRAREPERLAASQLDPATGEINWPDAFEGPEYDAYRETLDTGFSKWASSGGALGPDLYGEIMTAAEQMQVELKKHIRTMPPSDYMIARKFIRSLADEIRHPRT